MNPTHCRPFHPFYRRLGPRKTLLTRIAGVGSRVPMHGQVGPRRQSVLVCCILLYRALRSAVPDCAKPQRQPHRTRIAACDQTP